MTVASQGAQAAMYVEPGAAAHTFDTSSERYEFHSENLIKQGTMLDTNGIRGTRSHSMERRREGAYAVGGTVVMPVSPIMLDLWLPRILGAVESTDTFALAETLQTFGVLMDRVGGTFEYTDCYVNRATFRGAEGQLIQVALDIIGKTEATGTSAPAVSLSVAANNYPFLFFEGVLTVKAAAREMKDFELVIDNAIESSFRNSQTATSLTPTDRIITLRTTNPFTSAEMSTLYGAGTAGTSGSLVFTGTGSLGGTSTSFAFANLQFPTTSPTTTGKTEIPLILDMRATTSGATKELIVTNDSTVTP